MGLIDNDFVSETHAFHLTTSAIGICLAASGVGGVLGSMAAPPLFRRFGYYMFNAQFVGWLLTFACLAEWDGGHQLAHLFGRTRLSLAALALGPLFGAIVLRLHGPHDAVVAVLFLVGLRCVATPVLPDREVLCHPAEYIARSLHHRVAAWSHARR